MEQIQITFQRLVNNTENHKSFIAGWGRVVVSYLNLREYLNTNYFLMGEGKQINFSAVFILSIVRIL